MRNWPVIALLALWSIALVRADVCVVGYGGKSVAIYALQNGGVVTMTYRTKRSASVLMTNGWYINGGNHTVYRYGYSEDNYLFNLWAP